MVLRTLQILVKNSTSYCVNISLPPEYSNLMFTFFFMILPATSTICFISWMYSLEFFNIRIHPRKYISALRRISLVLGPVVGWLFVVGGTLLEFLFLHPHTPRKYISAVHGISFVIRSVVGWLFIVGGTLLVANIRSSDSIATFWV